MKSSHNVETALEIDKGVHRKYLEALAETYQHATGWDTCRQVLCGTGDGILNLFSWGEWGDISDRFPGHPLSIDSCVAVSDNVVCTGSMDGIIRYLL